MVRVGGNGKRAPSLREERAFSIRPACADASVLRPLLPIEQVIDTNRHCLHVTMEDGDNVAGKDGRSTSRSR